MSVLFVADVHLSTLEPAITAGFVKFLQTKALSATSLYILGDLFEFWIGDDDPSELHAYIAAELKKLKDHHVKCYFIHGNRDFLLGQKFAQLSGMTLLPQEKLIVVEKQKILILHGDTLCSDDVKYQRFRSIVNCRMVQKLFLFCPLNIRLWIANKLRNRSQHYYSTVKNDSIMDVNQQGVLKKLNEYQTNIMIHGHTHKPAVHQYDRQGHVAKRIVLGAWHTEGSYIEATSNIELIKFPL